MRSSEPPEHGRGRAHFAVLDPRQGSAADPAQRGKFVERPAAGLPQRAQAFGEAQIGAAGLHVGFHIRDNILDNESVKARPSAAHGRLDLPVPPLSCTLDILATEWIDVVGPLFHSGMAWAAPLHASALLALKLADIIAEDDTYVLVLAGLLLRATVFAAVHHAEMLAFKLGEPFGSILLAVAVTVIEAGLIVSIMLPGPPVVSASPETQRSRP
jgi:hypothetical protein